MEISELGEFGLIDHLTKDLPTVNPSTLRGVGDDCAVLRNHDTDILVTTDLLLEGVHFDLTYVPLKHLGYKSAIVNFSDVYAMNGAPKQITVSLGISSRFTVEHISELFPAYVSPVNSMVLISSEETPHRHIRDSSYPSPALARLLPTV